MKRISALILALVLVVSVFVSVSCAASKTDRFPTQNGVKTIDDLYTKCAEVQDEFSALMQSLSQELGAKLVMRPGLKSRERTVVKAARSYHNDYSKVLDVLAASLIFNSEEEIYRAVDKLKAKSNFVYFYDRWREHRYANGYRDYYTLVRLSNGIIAEVQLHHAAIFEFSGNGDHYIYEFVRSQRGKPEMLKYVKQARGIQREFFNAAAEGRYSSLSEDVKLSVRELAKELSSQTTSEGAEPILNRLSMIVKHELKMPEVKLFDNPEINKLIDENYIAVKEKGYAELRIPERLHRIPREKFSAAALDAADLLIRAGFQAYLAGGSVRDLILGTKVNDFDIVTDANFEEQKKIFAGHFSSHSHQNGINYGIAVYPGEEIYLAQMRNIPAAYYGLKNIPDFNPKELFSNNIRNDSFQRDLTINAVYYDMNTGDLIDFHGGLYALREGIIESPAEPDAHFTNDPTSAIRAMRFKVRYNFRFSDSVEKVMRENALKYMKLLTPESISGYLNRMFGHNYSKASYEVLNDYGVFEYFFPALKDICGTEKYKRYALKAMKILDAQRSPGKNLWLALLLWPAVKNSDVDTVLNEQGKIYRFSDEQVNSLKEIFMTEIAMESIRGKATGSSHKPVIISVDSVMTASPEAVK